MVTLVDNAIKYSPAGQAVAVEAVVGDGEAVIRVRDHGCGIPASILSGFSSDSTGSIRRGA